MSQTGYQGFRPDELEFQYNPRVSVAEYPELSKKRAAESAKVRSALKCWPDVPYGNSPREVMDIYPSVKQGGPVLVYYHGGYWRGGSKDDNCGFAPTFVKRGVNVAIVEYDLCPKVTVTEIVRQARASLAWIYRNIERYNGEPSKIYISGHSAGGHLGSMILAHDWTREGLPQNLVKGATLTSGVYDLEMVMHIGVNDEIRMTPDLVKENSPFLHPPLPICPLIVGVGGGEPEGWQRMSQEFFQLCKERGLNCSYMVIPGANHFTLPEHLADADSPLTQALFKQIGV